MYPYGGWCWSAIEVAKYMRGQLSIDSGRKAPIKPRGPALGRYETCVGLPDFLKQQAQRFRRLAREINDEHARAELVKLAEEYESQAVVLSAGDDN